MARSHADAVGPIRRRWATAALASALALAVAGCGTRAIEIAPLPADPAEFRTWDCERIDTEVDRVHKQAVDIAYAVDEQAGRNIVALGVGVTVFWPALLAMRPPGPESELLARLRGRHDALRTAAATQGCTSLGEKLPAARAAAMPVVVGERLVYTLRAGSRGAPRETALKVLALRRDAIELQSDPPDAAAAPAEDRWSQDLAGNLHTAPPGQLVWPQLLRHGLELGQVMGGEIRLSDEPLARARLRAQVVAVGEQRLAGRRFDAAVVELFGDVQRGDRGGRIDGALVVDRASGVLLRLDLRSAVPGFDLQRRLARIEAAP